MTTDIQPTSSEPDPEGTSTTMLFPKRISRHAGCHTDTTEATST